MNLNNESIENLQLVYNKIYNNALELILDGELLLENKRLARAYLCFQIAIEELGKLPMINTVAIKKHNREKIDWKELNRRLRSHKKKNSMADVMRRSFYTAVLMEKSYEPKLEISIHALKMAFKNYKEELKKNPQILLNQQVSSLFSFTEPSIERLKEDIELRNNKKNLSLYSDFNGKDFVSPNEYIEETDVKEIMVDAYFQQLVIEMSEIHINGFILFNKKGVLEEGTKLESFTMKNIMWLEKQREKDNK